MACLFGTMMPNSTEPISAGIFHAGSTCPFCQEAVVIRQNIVSCPNCSSIHHDSCWRHNGGCSSYHCDKKVTGNAANQRAEIVIQASELLNVFVPPPAVKRPSQDVAAAYLPKKPERLSRLAIGSVALTILSLIGIVGALKASNIQGFSSEWTPAASLLSLGVALAMAGLIAGVVSLIFISNTNNRISGLPWAGGSVLSAMVLIIVYFGSIGVAHSHSNQRHEVDMQLADNLPTEQQLDAMALAVRNAMRANLVIRAGGLGDSIYGSGVIVHVDDHQAFILTNKHVIGGSKDNIRALFYNGERGNAKVEWEAPGSVDIAILSCRVFSLDKYKHIEVLDEHVGPGEKVFAIGNPMALAWSYSEGTISSVRTSHADGGEVELYQTQTPINSGNSGGGLYTTAGVLVGINTMTHDKSTSEGLSFAITTAGILKLLKPADRERFFGAKDAPKNDLPKLENKP